MNVAELSIGRPETYHWAKRPVTTAIVKKPVAGPIYLHIQQFEGDGQADLRHHGGEDKAVCVYPAVHYSWWEQKLQRKLPPAAFGENITVSELTESTAHIGDVYQIGGAIVQLSQPRQPCFKLALRYGDTSFPVKVRETGWSGWYFRVLKEGMVKKGDEWNLLERQKSTMTVMEANRIMYQQEGGLEAVEVLASLPTLADVWKQQLRSIIRKAEGDQST
ncbi:MOSC domain-containing protein [Bacillus daqingensis]|uniref:MOSC domain-containing protein n=1 Tax=Bacillus daqingensis TaxID=872396 RepID=A0ABV9NWI5_9BACI